MLVEVRGDGLEVMSPYQPQGRERWNDGVLVQEALWHQIRHY